MACWRNSNGQPVVISLDTSASSQTSLIWLSATDTHGVILASTVGAGERWILTDIGTHFTIKLDTADTARERIWLSANADGTALDLWTAVGDNQRWLVSEQGDR